MPIDQSPFGLIHKLRSWFFSKDRDISLASDRGLFLGAGTEVTVSSMVPVGGIIVWSGSVGWIPANWQICDGTNSTPDLRDNFVVGAGSTYAVDATGGQATVNLEHSHAPGTLATDSDNHNHGSGTLATDSDNHNHGSGTLATDSDNHNHGSGTLATDSDSHTHGDGSLGADSDSHSHGNGSLLGASDAHTHGFTGNINTLNESASIEVQSGTGQFVARGNGSLHHVHTVQGVNLETLIDQDAHTHDVTGSTASDAHTHVVSGTTASDAHTHAVDTGSTDSDSHNHLVDTGSTDSDSHSHSVTTGATANGLSATADVLPPFYALAYIQRLA